MPLFTSSKSKRLCKHLQVKWGDGWQREDGTNTTSEPERIFDDDNGHFLNSWNVKMNNKRQQLAQINPIEVALFDTDDQEQAKMIEWQEQMEQLKITDNLPDDDPRLLPPFLSCEFFTSYNTHELNTGILAKINNYNDRGDKQEDAEGPYDDKVIQVPPSEPIMLPDAWHEKKYNPKKKRQAQSIVPQIRVEQKIKPKARKTANVSIT